MLADFIMMIGIPGSGKSTWIKENLEEEEYHIVCPDLIRKELTGDITDFSEDKKVWAIAKERVKEALEQGQNVVLDATNVNKGYRLGFLKDLPPCHLKAKICEVDPETAKERISKDMADEKDRSAVPDEIIERMYKEFETFCSRSQLEKEGFEIIE